MTTKTDYIINDLYNQISTIGINKTKLDLSQYQGVCESNRFLKSADDIDEFVASVKNLSISNSVASRALSFLSSLP